MAMSAAFLLLGKQSFLGGNPRASRVRVVIARTGLFDTISVAVTCFKDRSRRAGLSRKWAKIAHSRRLGRVKLRGDISWQAAQIRAGHAPLRVQHG